MLEKAIEIEGLLRIIRDGDPLPETYILLNIKAAELAEQALCLEERATVSAPVDDSMATKPEEDPESIPEQPTAQESSEDEKYDNPEVKEHEEPEPANYDMPEPEDQQPEEEEAIKNPATEQTEQTEPRFEPEINVYTEASAATGDFVLAADLSSPALPPVIFTKDDPALSHKSSKSKEEKTEPVDAIQAVVTSVYPDLEDEDLELPEDDEILLDFENASFLTPDGSETPAEEQKPIPIVTPELEILVSDIMNTGTTDTRDNSETIPELKNEPETTAETDSNIKPKRRIKLKAAFSLNDRFLYSRELFDGNMKMFDSTLEFIEGIEDYSIIEDYFYSELEWNPEDRNVATFMEILRPHFKE